MCLIILGADATVTLTNASRLRTLRQPMAANQTQLWSASASTAQTDPTAKSVRTTIGMCRGAGLPRKMPMSANVSAMPINYTRCWLMLFESDGRQSVKRQLVTYYSHVEWKGCPIQDQFYWPHRPVPQLGPNPRPYRSRISHYHLIIK